jgi:hypothetical protein
VGGDGPAGLARAGDKAQGSQSSHTWTVPCVHGQCAQHALRAHALQQSRRGHTRGHTKQRQLPSAPPPPVYAPPNEFINDDTTTRMLALPRMTRRGRSVRPRRNTRKKDTPLLDTRSVMVAAHTRQAGAREWGARRRWTGGGNEGRGHQDDHHEWARAHSPATSTTRR